MAVFPTCSGFASGQHCPSIYQPSQKVNETTALTMDLTTATGAGQTYVSPDSNPKHFQQSPVDDDQNNWSGADASSPEGAEEGSSKRKRPMSVSCELCKQRKVKCDRGQPSCGWCVKNSHVCEYKERKKPGLRAGYGRELEARLGELIKCFH